VGFLDFADGKIAPFVVGAARVQPLLASASFASGRIEAVESADEKVRLFNFLMQQKAPSPRLDEVRPEDVEAVAIWRLCVEHVSGKRGA